MSRVRFFHSRSHINQGNLLPERCGKLRIFCYEYQGRFIQIIKTSLRIINKFSPSKLIIMKERILITLFMGGLLPVSLQAQYHINLSHVEYPHLNYLKMGNPGPSGKEIRVNNLYLEEGGKPLLPVMGEVHYNRIHPRYWRDVLQKAKASGINIISTYCLWSLHEETEGTLQWQGQLDLHRFIELCKETGLKVHLRIGPYCNAEIRNGGLPDWIMNNHNLKVRTNDPLYLSYVRQWYKAIYNQIKGQLYKDGGPIIAIQLENEYVTPGLVVPHLMTLKKMAQEIGYDVPLYTMTHWMSSDYPKGELIPYAGYYIETPWTTHGKEEIKTSNFEYYTYNRLSDNIGTDIIKIKGDTESLSGKDNSSPYFTCEVGVGTTNFYNRRAVVPKEMAGENVNLRLGCGVNLMGYYMYAGGSNPTGLMNTFQSSGPRISYDYQAPIREFGTLGTVMSETRIYNYFMNDFGTVLAPAVAYLPVSNRKKENLQWAVRMSDNSGYLFCSNYFYRHQRKNYKNVQFTIKLAEETLKIPQKKVTVKNGACFLWPFNQTVNDVKINYATVQPICTMQDNNGFTAFFLEDDDIPAEYSIATTGIRSIQVYGGGQVKKESDRWFINKLTAGTSSCIKITKSNGTIMRLVTLNRNDAERLWKINANGKTAVLLTDATVVNEQKGLTLISEQPENIVKYYKDGQFISTSVTATPHKPLQATFRKVGPLTYASWLKMDGGSQITRSFTTATLSSIAQAWIRYSSENDIKCRINGADITKSTKTEQYQLAEVSSLLKNGLNTLTFKSASGQESNSVIASVEILLKNGQRILWNTDDTWLDVKTHRPVQLLPLKEKPSDFSQEEHLALYELNAPEVCSRDEETRLYLNYKGDVAEAYLNGELTHDSFYNGTEWIMSLSRLKSNINITPLIIRIKGLKSADAPIYFEKGIDPAGCVKPELETVSIKREYRLPLDL